MNAHEKDLIRKGFREYYHKSNPSRKRWLQLNEYDAGMAGWLPVQEDVPPPAPKQVAPPEPIAEENEPMPEIKKPTRRTRKTK